MSEKTYVPEGEVAPQSQIGATLDALSRTIHARKSADDKSYTKKLLTAEVSLVLGKVLEEAQEVVEAAEEGDIDHLRYEAGDLVYHLLVVLERYDISIQEFAAELNMRMNPDECPEGGIRLQAEFIKRGK